MTQADAECLGLRQMHDESVNVAGHLKWQALDKQHVQKGIAGSVEL